MCELNLYWLLSLYNNNYLLSNRNDFKFRYNSFPGNNKLLYCNLRGRQNIIFFHSGRAFLFFYTQAQVHAVVKLKIFLGQEGPKIVIIILYK